jgi:2-keto-4-pentenoate hydratase/2-oxohepta-3-ene-1,7-dioic acid hydratase in catechol pathway
MRLLCFTTDAGPRAGLALGEEVVDLAVAAPELPRDVASLLAGGAPVREALTRAARAPVPRLRIRDLSLAPPVRPSKLLAVALNYAEHVSETGRERPPFPTLFNKQVSCVVGPHDPIWMPRASDKLDYEGELAIVIGRRCRHVPASRASEVIGGYTICNDVTVRDWQARAATMTLGKSWDTHGPLGPWIVTPDEIDDPHGLTLSTFVDGERRQHANTREMIFDCYALVETLSEVCTLLPGDVISTGTPSGVGVAMRPRGYLKVGQRVRVEIDGIGAIENEVIPEPRDNVWR